MDHHVVAAAQQGESVDVRRTALGPGGRVVSIEMPGLVAAGEGAGGVTESQSTALGTGGEPAGAAQIEHLPAGVGDHEGDLPGAGQTFCRAGLQRSQADDPAE